VRLDFAPFNESSFSELCHLVVPTSITFLMQYGFALFLTKALTKDIEILLKFYRAFTTFWRKALIKFEGVCIQ